MLMDSPMNEESTKDSSTSKTPRPDGNASSPGNDLSRAIERSVDREPRDLVRCARVFGDFYRCNWWSRAGVQNPHSDAPWSRMIMDIVRKSCFLNVTLDAGKLVLKEIVANSASPVKVMRDLR